MIPQDVIGLGLVPLHTTEVVHAGHVSHDIGGTIGDDVRRERREPLVGHWGLDILLVGCAVRVLALLLGVWRELRLGLRRGPALARCLAWPGAGGIGGYGEPSSRCGSSLLGCCGHPGCRLLFTGSPIFDEKVQAPSGRIRGEGRDGDLCPSAPGGHPRVFCTPDGRNRRPAAVVLLAKVCVPVRSRMRSNCHNGAYSCSRAIVPKNAPSRRSVVLHEGVPDIFTQPARRRRIRRPAPHHLLIWPGSTRAQASLHFASAYTLVSWRCLLHR